MKTSASLSISTSLVCVGSAAAGALAFVGSLVGFVNLVGQVYPLFGYLGFLLIGAVVVGWLRVGRLAQA
ncbi:MULTISPECIES: hypothetical protein [Pseudomonas]|jgi:uncharacterized membrane protein YkvI|uniref:hypothetical protein n=1 Tax=Pseudomonas TaxID=286 RepID=UPI001241BDAE|nr:MULTISPECIES: hypothetical protein [Pseudomonas]MBV7526356.1 hypothetical protein [Pseudomonas sp. PDM29]VVN31435.1 hypothetical protein PS647_04892 [Pseudomonas fluorescens]